MKRFIFVEHTADIKFVAFGKSIEEVFENSAMAVKKVICGKKIKEKITEEISLHSKGKGIEGLMYDFLEEFLFLFDSKGFLLGKIKKIEIKEKLGKYSLKCKMAGDNAQNYEISSHVKAVTYNEMFVRKEGKKWISQVVIDV